MTARTLNGVIVVDGLQSFVLHGRLFSTHWAWIWFRARPYTPKPCDGDRPFRSVLFCPFLWIHLFSFCTSWHVMRFCPTVTVFFFPQRTFYFCFVLSTSSMWLRLDYRGVNVSATITRSIDQSIASKSVHAERFHSGLCTVPLSGCLIHFGMGLISVQHRNYSTYCSINSKIWSRLLKKVGVVPWMRRSIR